MKSSIERKLDSLRDKQSQIQQQIKKLEKEKSTELRNIRHKKYHMIGQVVLETIEAGQAVSLPSSEALLSLMDERLYRKTDRALFGLKSEGKSAAKKSAQTAKSSHDSQNSAPHQIETLVASNLEITAKTKSSESNNQASTVAVKSPTHLSSSHSQDELLKEFNL
ncbi:hypothetical protein Xen7305DRAFT_00024340 [Xenococcus sp. PCC 7305]|uniref:hypothetical protein n=1 Tax=Xenococcus sp. PCC 7305 TaxID=102125 RepID=UPI0002AC5E05|nr:hypothetical protein [Xenococcus sp. PCC 7305]ELS02716.1 hypothetical protein Xen7305DRAFT_00024340 [Xenococcus sp. PCC 7305]